jgi:hypothetical protein
MPDLTRRAALLLGGSAGLAGLAGTALGGPAGASTGTPWRAASRPPIPLRAGFGKGLGGGFLASNLHGRFRLTLTDIQDLPHGAAADHEHSFTLGFTPRGAGHLPQGIYHLTSLRVASCELFLAPVGIQRGQQRLQAVINRMS